MKKKNMLFTILFTLAALIVSGCTKDTSPVLPYDGPHEIQPLLKLAKSLSVDDIGSAAAVVTGSGIDNALTFELLVNPTAQTLYGTLLLPEGITSCDVTIYIYDAQERKIGQGSYSLTPSHFNTGRCVTTEIGIASALPRIDSTSPDTAVIINDLIALRAAASDSFGGTIEKYEWNFPGSAWIETSTGDTSIVAPSTAQAYVCSLRVTDDDGNTAVDAVTVTVETRAPTAVTSPDTAVFVGEQVNLRGSESTDETEIVEFAWKVGAGAWVVSTTGDTTIATPSTEQTLLCSLRVIDDDGNNTYGQVSISVIGTTIDDADGNTYTVVRIGNQFWTAENLRTTKYNDGTDIPQVTDGGAWGSLSTPGYCFYNNSTNSADQEKWGALYNWYVVDTANTKKIAPAGWHVPTDAEWTMLENYLIANGYNWDGSTSGNKIGKSLAAKTDWLSSSTAGDVGNDLSSNNSTGFSALPGGFRHGSGFAFQSSASRWWSATEVDASTAYQRSLISGRQDLSYSTTINFKVYGFSVRLVRDLD